jgi:hypothetical protein
MVGLTHVIQTLEQLQIRIRESDMVISRYEYGQFVQSEADSRVCAEG